jgi:hypothetical protein
VPVDSYLDGAKHLEDEERNECSSRAHNQCGSQNNKDFVAHAAWGKPLACKDHAQHQYHRSGEKESRLLPVRHASLAL